jgi:hypothetical protein
VLTVISALGPKTDFSSLRDPGRLISRKQTLRRFEQKVSYVFQRQLFEVE